MEIKKVGVVGCGQMGGGITQVCSQSGYPVLVSEINDELMQKGLAGIKSSLDRGVQRGRLTPPDRNAALARIRGTTDIGQFGDCDLIIEAAVENLDLKKKIFGQIDKVCPRHTILATNTSCLSVIEIASATKREEPGAGNALLQSRTGHEVAGDSQNHRHQR